MDSSASASASAAPPAGHDFLYQVQNAYYDKRAELDHKKLMITQQLKKARGELRALNAEYRATMDAMRAKKRAAKEERAKKVREFVEAADAARASLAVMLETLEKARSAAAGAGVELKVDWKYPPKAPFKMEPSQPLTEWQKFMKRVGSLLVANGVELHPGNRDVRLLAVFCSNIRYKRGMFEREDLDDALILALARSWTEQGGRAGVEAVGVDLWFNSVKATL